MCSGSLEMKAVLDQGQIPPEKQKGLRDFHQQIKTTVIWLTSMGYASSIKSTENVTKAVVRLPEILWVSLNKNFNAESFN